jgi:hypothetical protein
MNFAATDRGLPKANTLDYEISLKGARRMRLRFGVFTVGALIALTSLSVGAVAEASGDIPNYAVKIAGHHEGGETSWGVWLFGARHGQGCWGTRTVRDGIKSEEDVTCGLTIPKRAWQLAVSGTVGRPRHPASLLLFLTRPDVATLKVLVEDGQARRWVRLGARVVGGMKAEKARLPRPVGHALKVVAGTSLCPRWVRAFDHNGQLIEEGRLPPCGM